MQAFYGFATVLLLSILGLSMLAVGTIGFVLRRGIEPAFSIMSQLVVDASASCARSVLPMATLMRIFIHRAQISDDLCRAANASLGHHKGGLAHATVAAGAVFGMISGSALGAADDPRPDRRSGHPQAVHRGHRTGADGAALFFVAITIQAALNRGDSPEGGARLPLRERMAPLQGIGAARVVAAMTAQPGPGHGAPRYQARARFSGGSHIGSPSTIPKVS